MGELEPQEIGLVEKIMVSMSYIVRRNLRKSVLKRMVRFTLVGGSSTLIYWGLLYLLTDVVGLWYMSSAVLGAGIVYFYSFTLHSIWTFKRKK